jgi:hypothetical protein
MTTELSKGVVTQVSSYHRLRDGVTEVQVQFNAPKKVSA